MVLPPAGGHSRRYHLRVRGQLPNAFLYRAWTDREFTTASWGRVPPALGCHPATRRRWGSPLVTHLSAGDCRSLSELPTLQQTSLLARPVTPLRTRGG